jgi:hypothetical protein
VVTCLQTIALGMCQVLHAAATAAVARLSSPGHPNGRALRPDLALHHTYFFTPGSKPSAAIVLNIIREIL